MITKVRILAAQPKDKSYYLWDTAIKGFGVRVYPSGIKSFVLTYRSPHLPASRAKRFAVLGRTDSMSVRQARLQAFQELAAVHRGDLGLSERRKFRRDIPTLDTVLDRFFDKYAPQRISISPPHPEHRSPVPPRGQRRPPSCHGPSQGLRNQIFPCRERSHRPPAGCSQPRALLLVPNLLPLRKMGPPPTKQQSLLPYNPIPRTAQGPYPQLHRIPAPRRQPRRPR